MGTKLTKNLGWLLGLTIGYMLFTTILFGVLTYLHKIPDAWSFGHIAGITMGLLLVSHFAEKIIRDEK